jgi:glycerol kinase
VALVVGIDAGTTGVRAVAVDAWGRVVASSFRELTSRFPRPGWVEQDPAEIWQLVLAATAEVAAWAHQQGELVAAVGVTNQRETAVAWDRESGRPLAPAISWQDRRTAVRCRDLVEAGHLPLVRSRTGLVLDPYFSATKWEWLLTHADVAPVPGLALATVDSWIIWNLTGGAEGGQFVTDPSNASRTLVYDVTRLCWSDELCALFRVPRRGLPEVRPSTGRIGTTHPSTAPVAGVPVSGVVGDQQASLFGQACFRPGMAKNTYGTGSFVLMNVGPSLPAPADGLLTTVAWELAPGQVSYALEGSIFSTGATIQWLRDGLGVLTEAEETGPLAEGVKGTDGLHLVPAFAGLGSPWWEPGARGAIVGLSPGTTRAHLARAAVEAMAYQTRDVLDAMTAAFGRPAEVLRVDGGASVMDLLLQVQADQLGIPVLRSRDREATALGAAYLAGLAEGVWPSLSEVEALWEAAARFEPGPGRGGADARQAAWHEAVARARPWSAG